MMFKSKKRFLTSLMLIIELLECQPTFAAPQKFTGKDFSGIYKCKGSNTEVGVYEISASLKLIDQISQNDLGIYSVTLEANDIPIMNGQAIANGKKLALTLNLVGLKKGYSTGIASVKTGQNNNLTYENFYYELLDGKNIIGSEECSLKSVDTSQGSSEQINNSSISNSTQQNKSLEPVNSQKSPQEN